MTTTASSQLASGRIAPRSRAGSGRPVRGYASGKDDYLARLRKIEGQVRGIHKMIEIGRAHV